MSVTKPNPGKGYRLLRKGKNPEHVMEGDQVSYDGGDTWFHSGNYLGGLQTNCLWYRRRVSKPVPKTRKVTVWLNVYYKQFSLWEIGCVYKTKQGADHNKSLLKDRIGNRAHKVVIEIPVEKGEKK